MKLIRLNVAILALGVCMTGTGMVGILLTIGTEEYPYRGFMNSVSLVVIGTWLSIGSLVSYAILHRRHRKRLWERRESAALRYQRIGAALVRERYGIKELREVVAHRRYENDLESQSGEDPQACQRRPPRLRHLHVVRRGDPRR
jgi:hypothetical protein